MMQLFETIVLHEPFTSQRFCGSDNSFVDTTQDPFQIYFAPTDKFPSTYAGHQTVWRRIVIV